MKLTNYNVNLLLTMAAVGYYKTGTSTKICLWTDFICGLIALFCLNFNRNFTVVMVSSM